MKDIKFAEDLIKFIDNSPSSFHAVKLTSEILESEGYKYIDLKDEWGLKKGGKYYTKKNNSAIVAFQVGNGEIERSGFKIIASHTDSPGFKIKPDPEILVKNNYLKLNTEVYGGPILNTWLDRPLSIAGRVNLKSDDIFTPKEVLIDFKKPIMIIPNIAIHMNRNINKGFKLNTQEHTLPLISMVNKKFEEDNFILNKLSELLNISSSEILDFELYLYEAEKGSIVGLNNEFISSGKLDNLAMLHASLNAILKSEDSDSTNVLVSFDNEEVGSSTKQGAASPMLRKILERISLALGKNKSEYYRALENSFLISADMAHALHPNYLEKADPTNKPIINKGPAIKYAANQAYTTDSYSASIYKNICKNIDIPLQNFVNRSDLSGGSTIGPISSNQLDIPSIDIGSPILAMHSIRELGGVKDHYMIYKSFKYFYKCK